MREQSAVIHQKAAFEKEALEEISAIEDNPLNPLPNLEAKMVQRKRENTLSLFTGRKKEKEDKIENLSDAEKIVLFYKDNQEKLKLFENINTQFKENQKILATFPEAINKRAEEIIDIHKKYLNVAEKHLQVDDDAAKATEDHNKKQEKAEEVQKGFFENAISGLILPFSEFFGKDFTNLKEPFDENTESKKSNVDLIPSFGKSIYINNLPNQNNVMPSIDGGPKLQIPNIIDNMVPSDNIKSRLNMIQETGNNMAMKEILGGKAATNIINNISTNNVAAGEKTNNIISPSYIRPQDTDFLKYSSNGLIR